MHPFPSRAEVTPNQHVRLPRGIQLLHDESGRNLGIESVLVAACLGQRLLGPQEIDRMVFAVESSQLTAFFVGALAPRLGHNRRITLKGQ